MRRSATVIALAAILIHGGVEAADYTSTWQGAGLGAALGTALGGPAGLVIGAAAGMTLGHSRGLDHDLAATRAALEQSGEHKARLEREADALRAERTARLAALGDGLAVCIRFRSDSAALEPRFEGQLEALARVIAAFPELRVRLDAGADRRGSEAHNRALAERRAAQVAATLRRHGVAGERIETIAHGKALAGYAVDDLEGLGFDRFVILSLQPAGRS